MEINEIEVLKNAALEVFKEIKGLQKEEYCEEEKRKAAFALNMCMVSVSQIIDYEDINILEQEYEAILNNLNLEQMPKDEALLNILKQLLDTITFFRIQEGDKQMIDKEYQHKMKNAIWSAVPNIGMIVAGGNPITMAISLASQVGIGYMNYRRCKSDYELDKERQIWQLQRNAIEQFNGLRRELFDTAWRLADTYKFPDEYRLTERQIKQYNLILIDMDEIKKYERMSAIKDKFVAYPPFWYHFGNTANRIARNESLPLSDIARLNYKEEALKYFDKYWESISEFALLREDQLASACALEQIDLLDIQKDQLKIESLLKSAVEFSGNSNDILQLCAIAYLRINQQNEAEKILRILVNEGYNTVVNAQLLSAIYAQKVIANSDIVARSKYELLATRVNNSYLFRLPAINEKISEEELTDEFNAKQENILEMKFEAVIEYCFNDFNIKLAKLLPTPGAIEKYTDYYFSKEGLDQRNKEMKELFCSSYNRKRKEEYKEKLAQSRFIEAYFKVLNEFFDKISELNCLRDRQKLLDSIKKEILNSSNQINTLMQKIEDRKVEYEDICMLLSLLSVKYFDEIIKEIKTQINVSILGMVGMSQYMTTDYIVHMENIGLC